MKKIGLIVLILAIWSTAAFGFQFGLRAGANLSNITGDTYPLKDLKLGFTGGAFFESGIGDPISLRTEALYVQKGAHQDDTTTFLDYVEVPLLFGFRPAGPVAIYIGPYAAYNIKAETEIPGDGPGVGDAALQVAQTTDQADEIEDFDFGGVVGINVNLNFIKLDIRYQQGFTSIWEAGGQNWKNQTLTFSADIPL